MLKKDRKSEFRGDPVAPGQGGRMTAIDPAESLEEKIRLRAYELYELTGRQEGHAHEHWIAAEAQIKGKTRTW
jgi:hypothetical protein